mmetsp:Transcript_16271/g.30794  ORF Transcript_16271/g.30794 Transcript_16271/m.30794 type:complete len:566 (+) Transcript_16271:96-1793(+)
MNKTQSTIVATSRKKCKFKTASWLVLLVVLSLLLNDDAHNHVSAFTTPSSSLLLSGLVASSSFKCRYSCYSCRSFAYTVGHGQEGQEDAGKREDGGRGGGGEIWSCSSCPMDARLVLTCRQSSSGNSGSSTHPYTPLAQAETALWRIPEGAFRQNEIDYYPTEERDYDREKAFDDVNETTMSKVCHLDLGPGRVTDMLWNPGCIPSCDDEFGESLSSGRPVSSVIGSNLLTIQSVGEGSGSGSGSARNGQNKVIVTTWDIATTSSSNATANKMNTIELTIPMDRGLIPNPPKASWDPHNQNLCAVTLGTNIAILDMRMSNTGTTGGGGGVNHGLKHCHRFGVLDVDYNPKKPNIIVSSGQDGLVKFWDLRYTSSNGTAAVAAVTTNHPDDRDHATWSRQCPIKMLRGGHTHWTTCVKYNPYHDQLLLSAGTDSVVNLWRISSISSAPLLDLVDENGLPLNGSGSGKERDTFEKSMKNPFAVAAGGGPDNDEINDSLDTSFDDDTASQDTEYGNGPDIRVSMMEMREAVYDVCWSAADPWLYVTLGYDGNLVLNHVPSKEKYKILL